MNNQLSLIHLRKYLKTEQDADDLNEILTRVHSNLFKNTAPLLEQLDSEIPYDLKQALLALIQDNNALVTQKDEAEKFILLLKSTILALPRVQITLAFFPKEEIVDSMSSWFLTNFKKVIILQIEVEPALIGGSVIACNGKYKDYSIKNMLPNLAVN